jgi:phosphatidylglycerol:prolipoprotein diacylglycerol transferase
VFGLLMTLRVRRRPAPGTVFFLYIGLYSLGRFLIEAIRLDSFWLGPFRVAQIASVAGMALAAAGLVYLRRRARTAA